MNSLPFVASHVLVKSGISRFHHAFCDPNGSEIGHLKFPDGIPAASNSPRRNLVPSNLQDHVKIRAGSEDFRVEYDLLDSHTLGRPNLRFRLMQGEIGLASAQVQANNPTICLDWNGQKWELISLFSRLSGKMSYDLRRASPISDENANKSASETVGTLRQTTRFLALRRTFRLDFPVEMPLETQIFCFFLAVNATFS